MTRLRIATRASQLALAQARAVAELAHSALGVDSELVALETTGDRLQHASLAELGGKGLFAKEIQEALLDGRADAAVHSAKDLPGRTHPELALVAFPERADARDALVGRARGVRLDALARGARVGTGSVRRGAQLRARRPDLEIVPLRGNVPTRLRKLEEQNLDAIVLACAGLERLGLGDRIDERLDPDVMLPAVAQGAIAIECRRGGALADDLRRLSHAATAVCVTAERAFLTRLGGDCTVPLAAYAERVPQGLRLRALLASHDGRQIFREAREVPEAQAESVGVALAEAVLAAGGAALLGAVAGAPS